MGDTRAFEELVRLYQRRIVANCRSITNSNDAEDLAQETFVKAFFALRSFEGKSTFNHWLRRIKVNHCLSHLAKQHHRQSVDLREDSDLDHESLRVEPIAPAELEAANRNDRINLILAALPDHMRLPLVMRDMDGLSYEEIASSLGIGLSAVKMRIKRAREEFRRLYQDQA